MRLKSNKGLSQLPLSTIDVIVKKKIMFFLLCLLTIYIVILNKHFVEKFQTEYPNYAQKRFQRIVYSIAIWNRWTANDFYLF